MSEIEEGQLGVWLEETTWIEICGRGKLRCRFCGKEPLVEDVEVFADDGLCGDCAAAERRWARD